MIDLDELRKLAEAATPGPWEAVEDSNEWLADCPPTMEWLVSAADPGEDFYEEIIDWGNRGRGEDACYIAAANPQAVLELIERVRRVEAERDAALARIAELEKMLENYTREYPIECNKRVKAEARIAEAAKLHRPFEGFHGEMVCAHRYCVDGAMDQHKWPCPTAVALGLNEGEN